MTDDGATSLEDQALRDAIAVVRELAEGQWPREAYALLVVAKAAEAKLRDRKAGE